MLSQRRFNHTTRFFHLNSGLSDIVWSDKSMPERWALFNEALRQIQAKEDFVAHSFVLMTTHFHMLFSTTSPSENILAEEFHQILNTLTNRTHNALDYPPYCEPIISMEYYKNAYKYIYRNPIAAGLVYRVEDYNYSSLAGLLGKIPQPAPVVDNLGLIFGPAKILEWLNTAEGDLLLKFPMSLSLPPFLGPLYKLSHE